MKQQITFLTIYCFLTPKSKIILLDHWEVSSCFDQQKLLLVVAFPQMSPFMNANKVYDKSLSLF